MRLWHKNLIPVLPKQQLLGQWRECCLIAKNISEKGIPSHILVNKVLDYPLEHFWKYSLLVFYEMRHRGYKCDFDKFEKWIIESMAYGYIPTQDQLFPNWHNDRYLTQCYYNLQEKYDCGGISEDEWNKVAQAYNLRYTKKEEN